MAEKVSKEEEVKDDEAILLLFHFSFFLPQNIPRYFFFSPSKYSPYHSG